MFIKLIAGQGKLLNEIRQKVNICCVIDSLYGWGALYVITMRFFENQFADGKWQIDILKTLL